MRSVANKRALFVIPADVANGAERVTAHYAQALARRPGWEVTLRVVCSPREPSFGDTLSGCGVKVEYGPYPRERISLPAFVLSLARNRYDLVFSSILHLNGLISFAKGIGWLKADRLITRESNVFADRYFGFQRIVRTRFLRMYGAQDLIIAQTERMAEQLRPLLKGDLAKKVQVIPNPIDVKVVQDKAVIPLNPDLHARLTRRPYMVWMGRLIDWKRPTVAVDVLKAVREQTGMDLGLVILGAGPLMEETRDYVRVSGLDDAVIILGRQENPFSIARLCRVGLSTSLGLEGFPNVILEMMATGLPSIVTTPGADGLDQLPGIRVTSGFQVEEIAAQVTDVLLNDIDASALYIDALSLRHPDVLIGNLVPISAAGDVL